MSLIVPGVRVEARFDVPPPPPSPSGILGLVGVVDHDADRSLRSLTSAAEIRELFGPATRFAMPELLTALRNGVREVVVSPVATGAAATASRTLLDRDGEGVAILRARAPGPWGNAVTVSIDEILGVDGRSVRHVDVRVRVGGTLVEHHRSVVMDPQRPDRDLFSVLNRDSEVVVALDPMFLADNPAAVTDAAFTDGPAVAAVRQLTATGVPVLRVEASQAGDRGNLVSVSVTDGQPARVLLGEGNPSLRVTARDAGADPVAIQVVAGSGPGLVTLRVRQGAADPIDHPDLATLADAVRALAGNPLVRGEAVAGGSLPDATGSFENLTRTVTVRIAREGDVDEVAENRLTLTEIADHFRSNMFVRVTRLEGPAETDLPDPATPEVPDLNTGFLDGGRAAGRMLGLRGQTNTTADVLRIVPSEGEDASDWALTVQQQGDRVTLRLTEPASGRTLEEHEGLTMNPDDPRFLPQVLADGSDRLRAYDLAVRSRTTDFPRQTAGFVALEGGSAPATGDYLQAIDALQADERIDLLMASVQAHDDPNLDVRQVHQALLAYAVSAADRGAPAMALGSVAPAVNGDVAEILDHANDVRHQRFILTTPSGTDAAVAGLIGRMRVSDSPTFKAPGFLPVDAGTYRHAELRRLVDPISGNVLVVQKHPSRGIIVVKGIATNGWQINVTRTADMAVREVKRIAEGYIGQLNDEASRNALQQQIVAYLLRIEREGSIVPSTDGSDPAFHAQVYASQQDFAQGIVRVEIAIRPVRAIDYVYAVIRVRN